MKTVLVITMKFEDWFEEDPVHTDVILEMYPWVKYVIHVELFDIKRLSQIWCMQNLKYHYDIDIISYFEFEEDSVLFALRWC